MMWISLSSLRTSIHCGSLSRGPAITARLIRSGLSTNRTSELAQHEIHRPIDVRFPLPGHSSSVFSGGGEELFAFGLNLCLGGANDFAVARLCLFLELFGQFERLSPGVPQGRFALSFRLFLHCSNLSLHLFDFLESFLFAHAEHPGRTRLVFKGFRRVRDGADARTPRGARIFIRRFLSFQVDATRDRGSPMKS